nr:integrase, catalytic region, zinc finger, CCHC-type, peptidase aspartic, catalytic [Tanacetum cinerariifolium]
AKDCDTFDSDVDEAPTAQTRFNLSSADPIIDEAGPSYDSDILSENKVAIGYKNPLYLTHTKQAQPALYNGHEILKDNHAPAKVHNTEDTLEIAEITRKKMNAKMTDPECVTHKGRPNRGQGMNPQGGSAAGYEEAQNRDNSFNNDVDEQLVQDLALNMDNVFQAKDYDAFDSDVDEAPTAQTMFMANLSLADLITDEAGPSYDTNILSKANFELTEREQKINEQLRLVISDRNSKEEILKRELLSTKLQLAFTINRNKSMVEETTFLKQDFKRKENKYLA